MQLSSEVQTCLEDIYRNLWTASDTLAIHDAAHGANSTLNPNAMQAMREKAKLSTIDATAKLDELLELLGCSDFRFKP